VEPVVASRLSSTASLSLVLLLQPGTCARPQPGHASGRPHHGASNEPGTPKRARRQCNGQAVVLQLPRGGPQCRRSAAAAVHAGSASRAPTPGSNRKDELSCGERT
jgi:hypothetical protein